MAGQFDGKVALVTGAGSGIGRASAQTFAREGANVVVADISPDGGDETVRLIKDAGGEATFVRVDVSQASDVEALINAVVSNYGGLNLAHNNAGVLGEFAQTGESSEENWDRVIGINLKGIWLCLRGELRQMKEQGGGAIVNTASIAGLVGIRGLPAYVASKHGVAGLTRATALEYARAKIRVNAVCPGFIDTPMVAGHIQESYARNLPFGRLGTPQEVANAVVWLCSDAASYVTGHAMAVDGAMVAE